MNERTGMDTAYKFIGQAGQYLNAVPARNLTQRDLLEVEQREGITRTAIEASGLYVAVDAVEVEPFCGALKADGGRCKRRVPRWGERCYQHEEVNNGT